MRYIYLASILVFTLVTTVTAQDLNSSAQRSTLTITASAGSERVRITAPASIVQMHVEVYASGGEKLFDQEIRGGNVFDWHLQDGQAQRLAPGNYVCVVTAKSVSGKLTQKIGTVTVAETSSSVQPAEAIQLSRSQAQVIGPVEENSSWTITAKDEPQTPTLIANDGTDGQMIRGRGALSFRIGNFFSGSDQEQMRLTETGNLGIGISEPRAKLDVAGTIRAERFLVAKPNLAGDKSAAGTQAADSIQPLISGTGTTGRFTVWTDGASGALGDSIITQQAGSGFIGIGTSSPTQPLQVEAVAGGPGTSRTLSFNMTGTHAANSTYSFQAISSKGVGQFGVDTFFDSAGVAFMSGTAPGGFVFSANNANQHMRILASGNVGIGTASPATPLEVNGLLRGTRNGVAAQYIQLNGGDSGSIKLTAQSTVGAEKSLFIQNLSGEAAPGDFNTIQFQVGTTAAPSTKMIIDKDGNVGIGTTPETFEKLSIESGDNIAIVAHSNGDSVRINSETGTAVTGKGLSNNGTGVYGQGGIDGVVGVSSNGVGVEGISSNGDLFRGTSVGILRFRVATNGQVRSNVGFTTPAADFAELLPAEADLEAGDVLVIGRDGKLARSTRPRQPSLAGVYSTKPGFIGGQAIEARQTNNIPLAVVGIVPVKVTAENGPIRPGDLLTSSSTPGHAMRAGPRSAVGTVIGKAMGGLQTGSGVIEMLAVLQ